MVSKENQNKWKPICMEHNNQPRGGRWHNCRTAFIYSI